MLDIVIRFETVTTQPSGSNEVLSFFNFVVVREPPPLYRIAVNIFAVSDSGC